LHYKELIKSASLNYDAEFISFEANIQKRKTIGNPSEVGIIKFLETQLSLENTKSQNQRVYTIPFSS